MLHNLIPLDLEELDSEYNTVYIARYGVAVALFFCRSSNDFGFESEKAIKARITSLIR